MDRLGAEKQKLETQVTGLGQDKNDLKAELEKLMREKQGAGE